MKNIIKDRLEKIKNGQVPQGYKKTKIGIVPSEWEEISFDAIFKELSEYTNDLRKYPLYSLTIENGIVEKTERYERSYLVKKENSYKLLPTNYYAYNPMNIRFGAVARNKSNKDVIVSGYYDIFTTREKSDLKFMDSFLISNQMITYYNKVSTGSLLEKKRVHFSQFINFKLPLPQKEDREKIAEILSTQDKVIELQEKLIEEKQKQKKYLMQNLLTGKMRLKDFTDEWRKVKLGEVCYYKSSNISINSLNQNAKGEFPVFDANKIYAFVDFYEINQDYISIVKDGAGVGRLRLCSGKSSVIGTMGYILSDKCNINFLYYRISLVNFQNYINGSTTVSYTHLTLPTKA